MDKKSNAFVFRYRLVHVAHFAHQIRKRDLAKAGRSLTFLDFGKPQNGGDDRKRLIDALYRFVRSRLQLLQRPGAGATAFKRQPGAGQWRAQVMRYVIADTCKGVDESFHLIEHAIDDHRECGEGIVGRSMRESFTQVAGDDALNPYVDLHDTLWVRALSATPTVRQREHGGISDQARAPDQRRARSRDFIDISPDHQHVAVRQTSRDQADRLFLPATFVDPVDHSALHRIIGLEIGWEAFQITCDPAAVWAKQSCELNTTRILLQIAH